jgi:Domain of Unknown Function (DUF928)
VRKNNGRIGFIPGRYFMRTRRLALSIMLSVLFANPPASLGDSAGSCSHRIAQGKKQTEASGDLQPIPREKKSGSGTGMPVYAPPFRGAPAGRVGGGTRGGRDEMAYLLVLAPDHVGLTAQEHPSLYWFLSAPSAHPVEFTLIENKAAKPLLETRLESSNNSGLRHIRLSGHGVGLQPNVLYRWFVTLIPDAKRRSKDILSGGLIERIEPPGGLKRMLDKNAETASVHLYAEAGFWYDAFMTVCHLIERSPDDVYLRQMRDSLLEQVGLDQVARRLK